MNRKEVYLEVKDRVERWGKFNPGVPVGRCCLKWACETVMALHRRGVRAGVNAGTVQWRVCEDDGVNPDHFGYVFAWNEESELQILSGEMPEMHCWAVIRAQDSPTGQDQIIDTTVGFQTNRARDHGVSVDREFPVHLWFDCSSPPPTVSTIRTPPRPDWRTSSSHSGVSDETN